MLYIIPITANPLHAGHINIYNYVLKNKNVFDKIAFEISSTNVDKGGQNIHSIVRQFHEVTLPYIITNSGTFIAKIKYIRSFGSSWERPQSEYIPLSKNDLNGSITMCCGIDTFKRIYDPKYYADSTEQMERIFQDFDKNSVKFLVFERNGVKLSDLTDVPELLAKISSEAQDYTPINISSTEIREGKKNEQ